MGQKNVPYPIDTSGQVYVIIKIYEKDQHDADRTRRRCQMTIVKYILSTGVCSTKELLDLKREDPKGYEYLRKCAAEQAANLGVEITEEVGS